MSVCINLRFSIRFHGDEAVARAVQAVVDAVSRDEGILYEVPAWCEMADDGMYVVRGETDQPLITNGWWEWGPWFEAHIQHSVAELVPDAQVSFDWEVPDEEDLEVPDRVEEHRPMLPPMPATPPADWQDFAGRLVRVLADMPDHAYLILQASGNRYTQIATSPGEMYCEATSNRYLDPPYRMSAGQEALMRARGWSEPPDNGTVNWAKDLNPPSSPDDYANLADAVIHALSTALSVRAPTDLQVQAWRDGLSQVFPVEVLGLPRVPRPYKSIQLARMPRKKQPKLLSTAQKLLRRARFRRTP
ncbi:TY-Chap domain-containing protein [Nocardia sp. NPDC101769]|uniref:TY-Chap domain-containing protein n=1 Tax=Nocardia sp. NPDC101769 TaxID=3364333 RepID=UPI00381006E2